MTTGRGAIARGSVDAVPKTCERPENSAGQWWERPVRLDRPNPVSTAPGSTPSPWDRPPHDAAASPSMPPTWSAPTVPVEAPSGPSTGPGTTTLPPAPVPPSSPRPRRWAKRLGVGALALVLMVGSGVAGAFIATVVDEDDPTPPQRASDVSLDRSERDTDLPRMAVADVAAFMAPSIVTISADVESPQGQTAGQSVGTGVITTSDGEVLTNAHVVEGASEIRVRLAGESEPRQATLLASDPGNDLALLRIAGDDFTPATFAEPRSVAIGDEVVAIGFALDLDGAPSVTLGIVSALDRTIVTGDEFLDGLIQTDAAISSGNSGGPLVNAAGEVVGINTAVARGDFATAASNIGFAISVAEALPIIDQLRAAADGAVREDGFLGVSLDERTDGGQGAIVVEVEADTPAAEAGILAGDIVIDVDGTPINGSAGLVAAIRDRQPGDEIDVTVIRDGERITVSATLVERHEA